jgi:ankyrin repeat protein
LCYAVIHGLPYRDEAGRALLIAIKQNDANALRNLIRAGQDVNVKLYPRRSRKAVWLTPLHVAAMHANPEIIELLLAAGATADLRDATGNTPLHYAVGAYAAQEDKCTCIRLLVKHGANVNVVHPVTGYTLLIESVLVNNISETAVLIELGARVNQPDSEGRTPLHWTYRAEMALPPPPMANEINTTLLAAGADPSIADLKGVLPGGNRSTGVEDVPHTESAQP